VLYRIRLCLECSQVRSMSDNASYQISEGGCDNGAAVKDYDVQVVEGGSRENRWERLHRRSYWLTYVVIPLITLSHIASGHPWKQTLNPKKQRLRSVWYVQAGYWGHGEPPFFVSDFPSYTRSRNGSEQYSTPFSSSRTNSCAWIGTMCNARSAVNSSFLARAAGMREFRRVSRMRCLLGTCRLGSYLPFWGYSL
jgi:hypothetical protein